jgi:hypothetical protein
MTEELTGKLVNDSQALSRIVHRQTGGFKRAAIVSDILAMERYAIARKIVNFYPERGINLGVQVLTDKGKNTRKAREAEKRLNSAEVKELSTEFWKQTRLYSNCIAFVKGESTKNRILIDFSVNSLPATYRHTDRLESINISGTVYPDPYFFIGRSGQTIYTPDGWKADIGVLTNIIEPLAWLHNQQELMPAILRKQSMLALGIKGLAQRLKLMGDEGIKDVETRLETFDRQRDFNRSVAYDMENEQIDSVDMSISRVAEPIKETVRYIAANTDVPASEIFEFLGFSSGLTSTVANSELVRIQSASKVHEWAETHLLSWYYWLLKIWGYPDLIPSIPFTLPLTDREKADIGLKIAQRNKILIDSQIMTSEEARQSWSGFDQTIELNLDATREESIIADIAEVSQENIDSLAESLLETDGYSLVQE